MRVDAARDDSMLSSMRRQEEAGHRGSSRAALPALRRSGWLASGPSMIFVNEAASQLDRAARQVQRHHGDAILEAPR